MPWPDVYFLNFSRNGVTRTPLQPLFDVCEKISMSSDRLKGNYTFENLDVSGHLTFDGLARVDNHAIVAFAGVYRRGFWADGVYRFMNRAWSDPSLRSLRRYDGDDPEERFFIPRYLGRPQIELVRNNVNALFVSMEGPHAHRRLSYVRDHNAPVWKSGVKWILHNDYVQVAQGDGPGSWQAILYGNFKTGYDLANEPWMHNTKKHGDLF